MKILGIDTTTKVASATVLIDDKYYTKSIENEVTHSEKLLPIIDDALSSANTKLKDLDLFATINGPGSFTGIRIGLSTIKAFAQVLDIPIFSVSSLDLISYTVADKYFKEEKKENNNKKENTKVYVLSLIDARNTRVYYSINCIEKEKNGKLKKEEILKVQNDIITDINIPSYSPLIIAGDCVNNFKDILKEKNMENSNEENIEYINMYPTTEDLISSYFNIDLIDNYMFNAYSLDALYARASQAERMEKNGKELNN